MTVLDDIIAGVREDLAERMASTSLDQLKERVAATAPALDVKASLRPAGTNATTIISEVKRKSPSKGALADIPDPSYLASLYEAGGAAAISVLTEKRRFGGSLADLDAVRAKVNIPVLRKDFIVTEYQIWEARAHGADLVLLMISALDQPTVERFLSLVHELGMTALVEAHDEEEARRAVGAGAGVVGINARNLKTLSVDLATFDRVVAQVPSELIRVAESGVRGAQDVRNYANSGADVVLVGEALVTDGNPGQAIKDLVAAGQEPRSGATGATVVEN